MSKDIEVWGHRGCRYRPGIPESSKASFGIATKEAKGLELDVLYVDGRGVEGYEDGALVVTHSEKELMNRDAFPELNNDKYITEFTWAQLKDLKLKDHTGAVTTEPLPELNDILALVGEYRKTNVNNPDTTKKERAKNFVVSIEIKHHPENVTEDYIRNVVEKVAKAIEQRIKSGDWTMDNFEVRSFNMDILQAMRNRLPNVPIGTLLHDGNALDQESGKENGWNIKDRTKFEAKLADIKQKEIKPDNVSVTWQSFTPGNIAALDRFAKEIGKPIKRNAWTWKEEELNPQEREKFIATLVNNNIDTIITDEPGRVQKEIDDYRAKNAGWKKAAGQ